jgi:hypothetical protein
VPPGEKETLRVPARYDCINNQRNRQWLSLYGMALGQHSSRCHWVASSNRSAVLVRYGFIGEPEKLTPVVPNFRMPPLFVYWPTATGC